MQLKQFFFKGSCESHSVLKAFKYLLFISSFLLGAFSFQFVAFWPKCNGRAPIMPVHLCENENVCKKKKKSKETRSRTYNTRPFPERLKFSALYLNLRVLVSSLNLLALLNMMSLRSPRSCCKCLKKILQVSFRPIICQPFVSVKKLKTFSKKRLSHMCVILYSIVIGSESY